MMKAPSASLRRSTLAVVLALLGAGGLVYSNACFSPSGGYQMDADAKGMLIGLGATGVFLGYMAWAEHVQNKATPCRQPAADERMTAMEWRALADCQKGRGDDERAKASRYMARQLESKSVEPLGLPPTPVPAR